MQQEWSSPDDKIFKREIVAGIPGQKPYEGSIVKLNIICCPEILSPYNNKYLVVGDNYGEIGRLLDICICTMHLNERALFTVIINLDCISAELELVELQFDDFIFQWNAEKKYNMALKHKAQGAQLFAEENNLEAAYKFTKAFKIVSSIPIDVESTFDTVDNVKVSEIRNLKEKLLNNLSSCYFREQKYEMVIELCNKVLAYNQNNIKALYKIGVAYEMDRNFAKADEALSKVLKMEPHNKACAEHLNKVKINQKKGECKG